MNTTSDQYGTEQPDLQGLNAPDDDDFGPIDPEELARKRKARAERKAKANGSAAHGSAAEEPKRNDKGWRPVEPDEVLPPGVHVRMDMKTGRSQVEEPEETNLAGAEAASPGQARSKRTKSSPEDACALNARGKHKRLKVGDDVELAQKLADSVMPGVVYAEGAFWRYAATHWKEIPSHELNAAIRKLSGLSYGAQGKIAISGQRIKSIASVLADILAQPDFFECTSLGINAANGFITFDADHNPRLIAHSPDHRQRHVLSANWHSAAPSTPPETSLLAKLLSGAFKDDPEAEAKIWLAQQVACIAVLGHSTKLIRPKAIILYGKFAENGKDQFLTMYEGLLSTEAVSHIRPEDFNDDSKVRTLIGSLLNTSGELSAGAIAGDRFKGIITGSPCQPRGAYKPDVVKFRPQALHILAGNKLPAFLGGFDRGVKRRLAIIEFNRIIPMEERIYGAIGTRIVREEADLVLSWAMGAAQRILSTGAYDEPASSQRLVDEWTKTADPVPGWASDRVLPPAALMVVGEEAKPSRIPSAALFRDFRAWHLAEEGKPPSLNQRTFTSRLEALMLPGVRYIPGHNGFRGFEGIRLASLSPEMEAVFDREDPQGKLSRAHYPPPRLRGKQVPKDQRV
jgi:phage/plasmid-associated DNA primase